ncbi:hypothetical protein ACCE15_19060 [Pseudomonas parafulva]|uniref:hypothetical protein n=1 Tax=Pseudomonas parafulva TaxID=157782 RepID=UPI00356253ED
MKEEDQTFRNTIEMLSWVCQDISELEKMISHDGHIEALITVFKHYVGEAIIAIGDSAGQTNGVLINDLLVVKAEDAIAVQFPDDVLHCPVGNAFIYNNPEGPNIIQLDNDGQTLGISIVPNEVLSDSDQRLLVAFHFIMDSFNSDLENDEIAASFVELLLKSYVFSNATDTEKEQYIKDKVKELNNSCFISSLLNEALSNIKIHKGNEQDCIKIIEFIKSELPQLGKMDFRDFTLEYSKTASYYVMVRKDKTEITFTYDSELDYIFMAAKKDENRYTKENYEDSDEYRKLIIIESFLKAVAGKMKSKDFFNSIS